MARRPDVADPALPFFADSLEQNLPESLVRDIVSKVDRNEYKRQQAAPGLKVTTKAFGIGRRTNIDLSGEVVWPLTLPGDSNWYAVNLGTNSFGQGIAVTPIEMVQAVGAIANNGKMMAPHVLKAMVDKGRQYNTTPQVVGQPISAETAHTLTEMLSISLEKEASTALVPGYRVAGKTGTAEIPGPNGYSSNVTNASFVGWGPVDDPKFLIYIWLEKPNASIWGSVVAAPVFSEAFKTVATLTNLPPDAARKQLYGH